MTSPPDRAPTTRVGVVLTEQSITCETVGGFIKTEWHVGVNDGWLTVAQLVKRGRVGDISTSVEDEDDPHGVASRSHWADRPAQVWYRRSTRVTAPIGARFRKRVWTPIYHPTHGVSFSPMDSDFELRGEGRLVALHILAERAAQKARRASQREAPVGKEEALRHVSALLSRLAEKAPPAPAPAPVAESTPLGEAPADAPAGTRRRRAVELTQTLVESAPKTKRRPA